MKAVEVLLEEDKIYECEARFYKVDGDTLMVHDGLEWRISIMDFEDLTTLDFELVNK